MTRHKTCGPFAPLAMKAYKMLRFPSQTAFSFSRRYVEPPLMTSERCWIGFCKNSVSKSKRHKNGLVEAAYNCLIHL